MKINNRLQEWLVYPNLTLDEVDVLTSPGFVELCELAHQREEDIRDYLVEEMFPQEVMRVGGSKQNGVPRYRLKDYQYDAVQVNVNGAINEEFPILEKYRQIMDELMLKEKLVVKYHCFDSLDEVMKYYFEFRGGDNNPYKKEIANVVITPLQLSEIEADYNYGSISCADSDEQKTFGEMLNLLKHTIRTQPDCDLMYRSSVYRPF